MNNDRSTIQHAIGGFRLSQLISVVARLRVADRLTTGPKTVGELAQATGSHEDSLYRVLRTLAGLGIFAEQDGRLFGLTPSADFLRSDVPDSLRVAAEVVGEEWMWRPMGALLHSVMSGEPAFDHLYGGSTWDWFGQNPAASGLFNQLMDATTSADAKTIMSAFDFSDARMVVDIAGGQGVLVAAILRRHPSARGVLFNLPHVIESANRDAVGDVAHRLQFVAGDFFEAVPPGGDLYILKQILHDWNDDRSRDILATCHRAMAENTRLLIIEHLVCPPNHSCRGKAEDIQMMVRTGGRNRTTEEFRDLLIPSGFDLLAIIRPAGGPDVLEARCRKSGGRMSSFP